MRTDIRPRLATSAEFFSGPTIDVARRLVGATLERRIPKGEPDAGMVIAARIVETEAYLPLVDPACHAYRGPTKRTATVFGRPGHAYVYLIYGMYHCLNVTTEQPGIGAAVLIRAAEPQAGVAAMQHRRGTATPIEALASGPGNLCKAFGIDLRCDGLPLDGGDLSIFPWREQPLEVATSARIGLRVARAWPLRFYDPNSASFSPYRRRRKNPSIADSICR